MRRFFVQILGADSDPNWAIDLAREPEHCVFAYAMTAHQSDSLTNTCAPNLHVGGCRVGHQRTRATAEHALAPLMTENGFEQIDILRIGPAEDVERALDWMGPHIHGVKFLELELEAQHAPVEGPILTALRHRGFEFSTRRVPPDSPGRAAAVFRRWARHPDRLAVDEPGAPEAGAMDIHAPHVGWLRFEIGDAVGLRVREDAFELSEQAFTWMYLRAGDTYLDIGSHVGLYALLAAQAVGPTGSVVPIEPHPVSAQLCTFNLERNGHGHVTCLQAAVVPHSGDTVLYDPPPGHRAFASLNQRVVEAWDLQAESVPVPGLSFSDVVEHHGRDHPALVKFDIEGLETAVLEGTRALLLAGSVQALMVEFTQMNARSAGSSTTALYHLLEETGFTVCRFDLTGCQLVPVGTPPTADHINLIAVRSLAEANARLRTASPRACAIAADLIARHDLRQELEEDREARLRASQLWRHRSSELREEVANVRAQCEALDNEARRLEAHAAQVSARGASLEAAVVEAREGNTHLSQRLAEATRRLEEDAREREAQRALIERLRADARRLEEVAREREAQRVLIERLREDARRLGESERARQTQRAKIDRLSEDLQRLRRDFRASETERSELAAHVADLRAQLDHATGEIRAHAEAYQRVQDELSDATASLDARTAQIAALDAHLREVEADRAARLEVIHKLDAQRRKLETELNTLLEDMTVANRGLGGRMTELLHRLSGSMRA